MPRGKCRIVNAKAIVALNVTEHNVHKIYERALKLQERLSGREYSQYSVDMGNGISSSAALTEEGLKAAGKLVVVFIKKA